MWCKKRITNQNLLVRFKDEKHRFYLEAVCAEPVLNGDVCASCRTLVPQKKTQDVKTFDHGLVGDEYPPTSHIFESPWYSAKVKAYGPPSNEELELAMEAKKRASAGIKTKAMKDLVAALAKSSPVQKSAEPIQQVELIQLPPKKDTSESVLKETRKEEPKKSRKPRAPKKKKEINQPTNVDTCKKENVQEPILTKIPSSANMIETMDEPIKVNQVLRIVLKKFTYKDGTYWRDVEHNKLYKKTKDGNRGDYIGKWDSVGQCIIKETLESDED
jgi:hypothetical protein